MTTPVPAEQLPFLKRRAQAKRRTMGRVEMRGDSALLHRGDGSGFVKATLDGNTLKWTNNEWVPTDLLDRLAAERNLEKRAPMGDSHGSWQKVAEIPVALLLDRIPFDAWGDDRAMAKVLNDPDLRAFRADGNHRRF